VLRVPWDSRPCLRKLPGSWLALLQLPRRRPCWQHVPQNRSLLLLLLLLLS
jgi:hypothetical protein